MGNKKLRCGVLGAGWWSTFAHIPALLKHPSAELVAVQKRDLKAAQQVAADFKIPHACTRLEEMLELGLDALVIGTTPNVHFEQAKQALEAGLHILIEKPITIRAREAEILVDLAKKNHRQLVVSCPWHFTRHGMEARRLIRAGELGHIRMISILMTNFVEAFIRGTSTADSHSGKASYLEPNKLSYSDPAVAGGGQIYTQTSHIAAYLTFLTGQQPQSVFAKFDHAGAEMDLFNALIVEMANGTPSTIASVGAPMPSRRSYEVRVFGDEGMLYLELWNGKMQIYKRSGEILEPEDLQEDEIYPHAAPANHLVDCALGTVANGSPGELGLASALVIDAACASARTGKVVTCEEAKNPPR